MGFLIPEYDQLNALQKWLIGCTEKVLREISTCMNEHRYRWTMMNYVLKICSEINPRCSTTDIGLCFHCSTIFYFLFWNKTGRNIEALGYICLYSHYCNYLLSSEKGVVYWWWWIDMKSKRSKIVLVLL